MVRSILPWRNDQRPKCGISVKEWASTVLIPLWRIRQGKKLTNQSARKTLMKNLKAANQPRSAIISVTGHTNERSLADYEEADEKEQRLISSIISAECAMAQSSRVHQRLERLDVVNTAVANTFLMNDERSATVNHFHGCQVAKQEKQVIVHKRSVLSVQAFYIVTCGSFSTPFLSFSRLKNLLFTYFFDQLGNPPDSSFGKVHQKRPSSK